MTTAIMWQPTPEQIATARMTDFMRTINRNYHTNFTTYAELHAWSVERSDEFWKSIWDYFKIIGERGERIVVNPDQIPGAQWFPDAQLNFAENLLRYNDDHVALIFRGENGARDQHTYAELRSEVAALARSEEHTSELQSRPHLVC